PSASTSETSFAVATARRPPGRHSTSLALLPARYGLFVGFLFATIHVRTPVTSGAHTANAESSGAMHACQWITPSSATCVCWAAVLVVGSTGGSVVVAGTGPRVGRAGAFGAGCTGPRAPGPLKSIGLDEPCFLSGRISPEPSPCSWSTQSPLWSG